MVLLLNCSNRCAPGQPYMYKQQKVVMIVIAKGTRMGVSNSNLLSRSRMDHSLVPKDISRLHGKYLYARSKWKTIGCALGISPDDLEAIDVDNRKCEDCFREVLLRWLRLEVSKTESQLAKICESQKNSTSFCYTAAFVIIIACAVVIAGYTVREYAYEHLFGTDPIITAAQNLKAWYKNKPAIGFKLLDYATDMPFIDVTMEDDIDLWELLQNVDSKHWQLQRNSTAEDILERLVITGHPGVGKTTLMRYLAKEWANGRRLQSCQILFLIHLDALPKGVKPLSLSDLLKISPLKDYLYDVEQISKEIISKRGAGACFLLDSYNGWHWNNDFIYDLIFEAKLHSSLCVLTSRSFGNMAERSYVEYVQIVGFSSGHLEEYLGALSTNKSVTNSILDLWENNHNIKEMCELPLNMVMLIYIAKHGRKLDVCTKTQIYLSFLDTVIKHYFDDHHPQWNIISLRECIRNPVVVSYGDELCVAFKHLHYVASRMLFYYEDKFPENLTIHENINKLGFVHITKIKSIQDQVKYTFFHQTFLEFFAAIHLLTMPQEEWLYLYIEDIIQRHNFYETPDFLLFFFGLIGEHYGSDIFANTSITTLKQINTYFFPDETSEHDHPSPRLLGCCYGILEYIRELGWTGRKLVELLESTGTLVNSSLCTEDVFGLNELYSLMYILDHASIKEFRVGDRNRNIVFKVNNCGLEVHFLEAMEACGCMDILGDIKFSSTLSSIFHIHFDIWESIGVTALDCLLKTASNLRSLHVGLEGLDFETLSTAMISINNIMWRETLENLSMNVDLKCNQLASFVGKFNKLPNELILKLKVNLTISDESQGDSCKKAAPLLGTLKESHRLKELTLVLPSAHYLLSSQEWILLHQLTGLEHLSIAFDNLGSINDKILDRLRVLNELDSLEIYNTQFGNSAMESLLKSLPQLTLQKLTLDHDNLTDHHIYMLANILSDSMHKLKSLSLRYNSITGKGIKLLVTALKSHSEFYSLDLSGNPIKENEGLEALQELNTLSVLNLTNCDIGDVEIEKLANAHSSNENLRFLNLSGNPFIGSEIGLAPLAQLTSLYQLDITGWSNESQAINGEDKKQTASVNKKRDETLNYVLKHLTQLRLLNLCSSTDTPIHWSRELANTLSNLSELQLFNAPCLKLTRTRKIG